MATLGASRFRSRTRSKAPDDVDRSNGADSSLVPFSYASVAILCLMHTPTEPGGPLQKRLEAFIEGIEGVDAGAMSRPSTRPVWLPAASANCSRSSHWTTPSPGHSVLGSEGSRSCWAMCASSMCSSCWSGNWRRTTDTPLHRCGPSVPRLHRRASTRVSDCPRPPPPPPPATIARAPRPARSGPLPTDSGQP